MPQPHAARPSISTLSSRLEQVSVLIADSDLKIAVLVKTVLLSLGFKRIFIVPDGTEALKLLKEEPVDLVITDWQMRQMDGIDLVRYLRQSPDSPNRMLPVIMLTARAGRQDVLAARDAGITEFVTKPFSSKTLLDRIVWVVENPRSFVFARSFAGPDRRRRPFPEGQKSEKRAPEKQELKVVGKSQLKHLFNLDQPVMVLPDFELKKKIGLHADIKRIVGAPSLKQSQQVIDGIQQDFLDWIAGDMVVLRKAVTGLRRDPRLMPTFQAQLRNTAFSIKSRAGTFGYARASEAAASLYRFSTEVPFNSDGDYAAVLEKHVDALSTIFGENILGDGGAQGQALMGELKSIVQSYA